MLNGAVSTGSSSAAPPARSAAGTSQKPKITRPTSVALAMSMYQ